MAIEDRNLKPGTKLNGRYLKQDYACEVIETEDEKTKEKVVRYRLEDGQVFKSPSSAASSVMGGKAVNGWRFWSVAGVEDPKSTDSSTGATEAATPGTEPTGKTTDGKTDGEKPAGKRAGTGGSVRTQGTGRIASSETSRGAADVMPALPVRVHVEKRLQNISGLSDLLLPELQTPVQRTYQHAL